MRVTIAAAAIAIAAALSPAAHADQFVSGYFRQNGTYVNPYVRTTPDSSLFNNYSTAPNINPYTGHVGTVNPYAAPAPNYGVPNGSRVTPSWMR